MFLVSDFWRQVFRSPFYNWFSKNWYSTATIAIRNHWGIGMHHLQRESSFKGTKEDEPSQKILALPFAAATGAGVITLLGILGQNRGLSKECQEGAIQVLARLCSCIKQTSLTIRVLPDWSVRVIDLSVQMDTFFGYNGEHPDKAMKQRILVAIQRYCFYFRFHHESFVV